MGRPLHAAAPLLPLLLLLRSASGLRTANPFHIFPIKIGSMVPPQPEHTKCKVSASNTCSFDSLPNRKVSLVFPDPATSKARCLTSGKSDFGFQVIPRDPSKVIIWFEGGGACWSKSTTMKIRTCWRDQIYAFPEVEMFDGSQTENHFKDYTVVMVNACTGDLHSGNTTRDYLDEDGAPVQQRGYYNTRAVIDWVKANLGQKPIADLLIAGESAGAIGVQVWSRVLLTELPYKRVGVVADSYAGVFPAHFQGKVFKTLGVCGTGLLQLPELEKKCQNEEIEIADVFEATVRDFPNVPFAMINSKYDVQQQMFYKVAADSIGAPPITPQEYHNRTVEIFRRHNRYPNIVFYLATTTQHVFLLGYVPFKNTTEADLTSVSPFSLIRNPEVKQSALDNFLDTTNGIQNWIASFPPASGSKLASRCEWRDTRHLKPLHMSQYPADVDFCEEDLTGKSFVVP